MKLIFRSLIFAVVFVALLYLAITVCGYLLLRELAAASDNESARITVAHAAAERLRNWELPAIMAGTILLSALIAFGGKARVFVTGSILATAAFFCLRAGGLAYVLRHMPRPDSWLPKAPTSSQIGAGHPQASASAQWNAVQAFPDLGEPNSKLNQEFLRRYHAYEMSNKAYFDDPEWPTRLAREANEAIQGH